MSAKPAFTPPPWRAFDGAIINSPHAFYVTREDGYGLAVCWLPKMANDQLNAEQVANAELIAGAPELYHELRQLFLGVLDMRRRKVIDETTDYQWLDEVLRSAADVLGKAATL